MMQIIEPASKTEPVFQYQSPTPAPKRTMNHHFITIEGNIGAGKTTLAHLLSKHYNARLILEEFADNPFLPKFYENPGQFAFPLELFFMAERYKQLKELIHTKDLFQSITVSDYLFSKCLLFAKVNLPEEEFRLYQRLFEIIHQQLVQPDILIYLHAPVSKLQQNIKRRNRSYEQSIQDGYLFKIQETYTSYIKQHNIKTLFVDASNADFLGNEKHLQIIIDALEKDLDDGQHYFTLP
ncbi:MAG: deoxynucleoside kinase [Flavihumibacter sp.]|nr:deoxynucleoside kinase [Flavihumibacter sp.]